MSGSSLGHPIRPPSGRDGLAGGRWLPYRPGTAAKAAGQPADVSQLLGASRGRVDADQVITIRATSLHPVHQTLSTNLASSRCTVSTCMPGKSINRSVRGHQVAPEAHVE